MIDTLFEFLAQILNFLYSVIPNYAVAIMLMTLLVMVVTTPLTLKGTRGMIKMQLLQPELKKIQDKHKGGDRQEMNAELMAFYQENELNPLGGCLPLLVQAPVFLLLYRLIDGLTKRDADGFFAPKYLSESSELYRALHGSKDMVSVGLDLSETTSGALGESILHGLPYLTLILIMIGAQYYQQRQVSARNPEGQLVMPQQQMLLRVMPVFFGVISINFPTALVVYWVTSSVYRIGLQAYITRSLYGHEDSLGQQANRARREAKPGTDDKNQARGGRNPAPPADKPGSGSDNGRTSGPPPSGPSSGASSGGRYQPSSKKKKKRKR